MEKKDISQTVISRLPRYFRYLGDLKDQGVERVSSKELSEIMQVTASQIRQDLNHFGGFGQQGYGYNVESLYGEIGKILGLNTAHNMILIGAGNLGQALVNYVSFQRRGFYFQGIFDVNPMIIGKEIREIPVQPMSELEAFMKTHAIDIAVLTVPRGEVVAVAENLVSYGIKAIWNFAHVDLRLPGHVQVENVHLADSLFKLSYNVSVNTEEED